jgi:replication factor A1
VKRELTLVDRSNSSIRLTLWGKQAETYEDDGSNPVIAFKGVRIGEFQGETIWL